MYFSAFPEEFSVMSVIIPEELFFPPMLCEGMSPSQGGVTSWGCQSSATTRPPPPPAGRPGASPPRPEKAVR